MLYQNGLKIGIAYIAVPGKSLFEICMSVRQLLRTKTLFSWDVTARVHGFSVNMIFMYIQTDIAPSYDAEKYRPLASFCIKRKVRHS